MIYETFDISKHDTRKVAKLIYDVDFRTFDLLFKNSDKAISTIEKQLKKEESLEDTKVILDDDVVDSYFEKVKCDLIDDIDKQNGQFLLDILMIAKYIERVGDHATNIAEWVVYGLTGSHPEETN